MNNRFSYKIDYDAEIAEDERNIAWCNKIAALVPPAAERNCVHTTPAELALLCPEPFGLDATELNALRAYLDPGDPYSDYPEYEDRPGETVAGRAVFERIEKEWGSDVIPSPERFKRLRKAYRNDLTRHRRNKEKFG